MYNFIIYHVTGNEGQFHIENFNVHIKYIMSYQIHLEKSVSYINSYSETIKFKVSTKV